MKRKFRSLSRRLSLRIIIVITMIMILTGWSIVTWNRQAMRNVSSDHYHVLLHATKKLIENNIQQGHNKKADATTVQENVNPMGWMHQWLKQQDIRTNGEEFAKIDKTLGSHKKVWIYSIIVDSKGNYIHNPDPQRMHEDNFFEDIDAEEDDTASAHIINNFKKGIGGETSASIDDTDVDVYYDKIEGTDWMMAIIVPKKIENTMVATLSLMQALSLVIAIVMIYFVCRFTIRRTTRPLNALADSAREMGKGRFDVSLPKVRQNDEVRLLRDTLDEMQTSLHGYVDELQTTTAEKTSIERELSIARNIQMAMVPKNFPPYPERTDIDIYGTMTTAKSVGGDLFDFFIRDEKLFFTIGDVSGKGVPAALVMAVARSLFRTIANEEYQPERIMSRMNTVLCEDNESGWYVTMLIGVLDPKTGRLDYCNAGHIPPLVIGREVSRLSLTPTLPVGALPTTRFAHSTIHLPSPTTLLLYTDGLLEAKDVDHKLFGTRRILDIATTAHKDKQVSPTEIINAMAKAVEWFVGDAEQSDDLTMLAIRYTPENSKEKHTHTLEQLPVSLEAMHQVNELVADVTNNMGMDEKSARQIRLIVEEAVGNVINYSDATTMSLSIDEQKDGLMITVTDDGKPFDPTTMPPPDLSIPGTERAIGGLGIHYMRQMSDSMTYQRKENKNVLRMIKKKM